LRDFTIQRTLKQLHGLTRQHAATTTSTTVTRKQHSNYQLSSYLPLLSTKSM